MKVSQSTPLRAEKSKFTTKTKFLTIVIKRNFKTSKDYNVEIMIDPVQGTQTSKYHVCMHRIYGG